MENLIRAWSMRKLSLRGKVTVIKSVYSFMINKIAHYEPVQAKWADSTNIVESTEELFGRIEKMTIVSRLRSFQFKFLHKILFFNDKLFIFKLVNTTMCEFCNDSIDSMEHRYFYCKVTQRFWKETEQWLKYKYNVEHTLNNVHLIVTNICLFPIIEIVMSNYIYFNAF